MKTKFSAFALAFAAALSFSMMPGCDSPSTTTVSESSEHDGDHAEDHEDHGHDHEDHGHDHGSDDHDHNFKSLSQAVEEIVSLRDSIRDGFASDDADAAHGPLHHIGEVLLATEEMIKSMEDSETKVAAAAAVKTLLDDFTAVDDSLHGSDDGKSYDDVSKSIDDAVETLEKAAGEE